MEDGFSNNNKIFTLVTDNIQNKFYSHTTCLFLVVFIHIKMYLPFIFYITIYQLSQITCTCLKNLLIQKIPISAYLVLNTYYRIIRSKCLPCDLIKYMIC